MMWWWRLANANGGERDIQGSGSRRINGWLLLLVVLSLGTRATSVPRGGAEKRNTRTILFVRACELRCAVQLQWQRCIYPWWTKAVIC